MEDYKIKKLSSKKCKLNYEEPYGAPEKKVRGATRQ
jgi:hypothetical protein